MERKKKPNGLLISGLISALASLAIVAVAPSFAGNDEPKEKPEQSQAAQAEQSKGTEDTKGNDRKSGYEDNSKTPQEPNHGQGADNDGDADSDPSTAYEDDHDTSDDGDNAHPSGKDRSVENGGSGNQGKAESNPDDSKGPMRYEGVQGDDKPGGPGGTDLDDQDGNNGCGNDDDFNDDNNGWCGKPVKPTDEVEGDQITRPCDKDDNMANGIQPCEKDEEVLPELEENPVLPEDEVLDDEVLGAQLAKDKAEAEAEAPSVLGIRLSPALNAPVKVAGAVLPFTGGDVLSFLALALALFASGVLIMRSSRKSHQS